MLNGIKRDVCDQQNLGNSTGQITCTLHKSVIGKRDERELYCNIWTFIDLHSNCLQ